MAASARKDDAKRGLAEAPAAVVASEPSSFPAPVRVLVLTLLLFLAAYTIFVGIRIHRSATAASDPSPGAAALASHAAIVLAPIRSAADAVERLAALSPGTSANDLAASALKLGGASAASVAIVQDGQLVGVAGPAVGVDWVRTATYPAGLMLAQRTGAVSDVVFSKHVRNSPNTVLIIALREGAFIKTPLSAALTSALVLKSGQIISASENGLAGANVDAAFGISLSQLEDDLKAGRETVVKPPSADRQFRMSVVPVESDNLSAIAAQPVADITQASGNHLVQDTIALLAPVAISLCLSLVVFRQARTAELAKRERMEVERKFRSAVEAAHCGIWEWRIREDMVDLSDLTGIMFGWGGGGLAKGDDVLARIAPEHRERVRNALVDAAEHGAFDVTFKVPGPNGDSWIDCRGQGIGERDELGYAAIMGVALDVTRERIARARGLAAEARLNDAIESVSEAFVLWDRRGRLVMCNKNYQDFFALDARLLKPGTSRDVIQQVAEIAVRDHRPAPDANPDVREAEMVDGRWLQISERRTSDNGVVMTAADITAVKRQEEARRRNEQALQRAVVRLEENGAQLADLAAKYEQEKIRAQQANAAKSEFLANMSHELRTPLNAINGFSEMMAKEMIGPLGDRRYVEYAQDIHNSGHHLLALINDILDMAKIEAGKHSLHLEQVDLSGVAEEAVRLMRNRADDGGLVVSLDMPDLPRVEADHRAVKQVILNLLSNSIKFTPRGGQVRIAARAVGEVVQISVMDTGIGISKEDLDRLAQPFQQVEHQHAKTQHGTGLGLALSKSLVELHEGRFDMASEPGRGTTVSFTLPLRQRKAPQRQASGEVNAA